jgi:pSer/pThr/pTyr-binding forkhead associated (FHA) protein
MVELQLESLLGADLKEMGGYGKIAVGDFPFVIGRSRACHLCLSSNSISRAHCRLSEREGRPWVEDLGSLNGTFVNEERVEEARPLKDGDLLRLACKVFMVHAEDSAAGKSLERTDRSDSEQWRVPDLVF